MKYEERFSILLTFVMGLVAGGYLYLSQAAPFEAKVTTPVAEDVRSFSIEAELYGSCGDRCPHFFIGHDWSYRYSHVPKSTEERQIDEGVIPFAYRGDINRNLHEEILIAQSALANDDALCDYSGQEIDVRYKITTKGTDYELDSCETMVDYDSELWRGLNGLWSYLMKIES